MEKVLHGRVHGKAIHLLEEIGLPEGQQVELVVRVLPPQRQWGEGILRSAGAMAPFWTEDDDRILAEINQERKRTNQREIPE